MYNIHTYTMCDLHRGFLQIQLWVGCRSTPILHPGNTPLLQWSRLGVFTLIVGMFLWALFAGREGGVLLCRSSVGGHLVLLSGVVLPGKS